MKSISLAFLVIFGASVAACKGPDANYIDAGDDTGVPPDAIADDIPPETTITAQPDDPSASADSTFEFSSEDGATFECRVDDAAFVACESGITVTVTDGSHTFEVRAIDSFDNIDPTPATFTWLTDTTAPDTTITEAPPVLDNSVDVAFRFEANEDATFECQVDGDAFAPCTVPFTSIGLTDGAHTFAVRATDTAGNVDTTPAVHEWTIDSSTPDTTIDSGPIGAVSSTSATLTFSSPDTDNVHFECRLDGAAFAACTSPVSFSGLAEGEHTFEARAIDQVGNTDPTPAARTWTIDVSAPDTQITGGPTGTVSSGAPSFTFTSAESGVTFQCSLDSATFVACTSPFTTTLPDGDHSFSVRACDDVGNCDASPATRTWTIDTGAPDTSITGGPTGTVSSASASLTFTSPEGGVTFQCSRDAAAFTACTSPQAYSGLAEGAHTFSVRACDAVANCDASPATRSWAVDTVAPDTQITAGPTGTVTTASATFSFSLVTAESGATLQCSLDGAAYATCTSPRTYPTLAEGAHTVGVRACDATGNCDASPATRAWTVDTVAPDTQITAGPTGTVTSASATFSFSLVAAESGATLQCSLDGAAYATCTSPRTYPGLAEGAHTFGARACDVNGTCDATPATRSWSVDTLPPDTQITAGPTGTVSATSATFSFSLVTADAGATLQCSLDGAAYATCTSPTTYSGLAQGAHTFGARACDSLDNCDASPATRAWTVDSVAPDTQITAGPTGTVTSTSATLTFSIVTAEAGAYLQCSLDGAAYATCTSPAAYSNLGQGAHTFGARACDSLANCDASPATRAWTVDTSAPDTQITAGPTGTVASTSATLTFSIVTAEAGSYLQCSLDGAAYATCTSPAAYSNLGQGAHTFGARACDSLANCDASPATRSWTVDTAPPDTQITAGPTGTVTSTSATLTFSIVTAEAGSYLQCSLDGAAYATCTSPATYSNLGQGSHTFGARACDSLANCDASPATRAWTVDSVAPDTQITAGPTGTVTSTSASFTFSIVTAEAGAYLQCSLDGAAYATCTSPAAYSNLGQGAHTFGARACDSLNNCDASPATRAWTVDTGAPDTQITAGPTGTVATTSATLTFSIVTAEAGSYLQCSLDGAAYATCTSPATYSNLAQGAHTFGARACDSLANCDATPATRAWTVDTAPPDTQITAGPTGTVTSTSASLTFSIVTAEAGSYLQCSLDGAAYATCTSPQAYSNLGQGAHTFGARACDSLNNCDASPATRAWTVDSVAPDTQITAGPTGTVASTSATLTFSIVTAEAGAYLQCSLDGAAYATCTSPAAYSNLGQGAHTFGARACDSLNNCDASPATRSWTIDSAAPDTQITAGPTGPTASTSATFTFSIVTAEAGSYLQCSLDGAAYATCTSPAAYSNLAQGSHTFGARACDSLNNCDATPATRTWSADTAPPDTQITSGPQTTVATTSATFAFSLTAAESGAYLQCSLDNAAFATCTSPQAFSNLAQGAHSFRARACDSLNNCDATPASRTWAVDTVAPDTTIGTNVLIPWAVNYADFYLASNNQPDLAGYQCNLDATGWVACNANHTLTVSYSFAHSYQARACDTLGNCDTSPAMFNWVANRGLVVYLPLDRHLSNTTTLGPEHDGSATIPDWYNGVFGHSPYVDTVGLKVSSTQRPMSSAPDRGYTMAAWTYSGGSAHRVFDTQGASGCYLEDQTFAIRMCCRAVNGPDRCHTNTSTILPQQGFRHLALVSEADSGNVVLYVNGRQTDVLANPGETWFDIQNNGLQVNAGSITLTDEVRLYNTELTSTELCTLAGGAENADGCFNQYPGRPGMEFHLDGTTLGTNTGYWTNLDPSNGASTSVVGAILNAIRKASGTLLTVYNTNIQGLSSTDDIVVGFWFRDVTGTGTNLPLVDMRCDGTECQGPGGLYFAESSNGVQVCYGSSAGGQCANVAASQDQWHHVAVRARNSGAAAVFTTSLQVFLDGVLAHTFSLPANINVFTWMPPLTLPTFAGPSAVYVELDEMEIWTSYFPADMMCALALGNWNGATCN